MPEIIYHTANETNNEKNYLNILDKDTDYIELDIVFTKDLEPIWTHDMLPTKLLNSDNNQLKNNLSLYDIIDLTGYKKELLLDFKYIDNSIIREEKLKKVLDYINEYDEVMIQSTNKDFINYLITKKYPNINKGLIINYFSSFGINKNNIGNLKNVDFISLASEIWELYRGDFLNKTKQIFPNSKKYAWTWEMLYDESTKRLQNYIDKSADAIITNKIDEVKRLIKKN